MKSITTVILCAALFNCSGQPESMRELLQNHLGDDPGKPVYSIIVGYENPGEDELFKAHAVGLRDKDGSNVSGSDQFRIASVTKTFTATIIMQLAEEGKLDISEPFLKYIQTVEDLSLDSLHVSGGVNHTGEITIQNLLSHRTGLPDIYVDTGDKFFAQLFNDPQRQYTPKDVIETFFAYGLNTSPHFSPGASWKYSDLNYVLLGLIIEELEGVTYGESMRKRILEPLGMEHIYLEFHEPIHGETAMLNQYYGDVNMTNVNTSFDWAGGGLVSTAGDLALFFKGLFSGRLMSEESLAQMVDVQDTGPESLKYGYGIFETIWNGVTYYGHYGFYGTYAGYAPEIGRSFVYNISQGTPPFNPHNLMEQVIQSID